MQTVAELPAFISKAEKLLTELGRQALVTHLAEFPKSGVIMQGTGGIRKLRWARQGTGKSGGARVVYYYHDERIPLYLLTIFGKGEKDNLSKAERNELAKLTRLLSRHGG
jgi:hypothetical protein